MQSFGELGEVFEADQLRQERWWELGLFIAWHVEAFARQKTLQNWPGVLAKFRSQRKAKPWKPVQDWRLEKEHMQAIRDRHAATTTPKKKDTTT